MRELFRDEVEQVTAEFSLPLLPAYYDGPGYRDLVLFTAGGPHALLTQCSLEDAMDYCGRQDAHGPGWFVGFAVPEGAEPVTVDTDDEPGIVIEDGLTF